MCFIVSEVTGNLSQVDRLWSVMPWLYYWYWAWRGGFTARPVLMAAAATVWGLRLSYNFARKGGYSGGEDYRWPIIRKQASGRARARVRRATSFKR